MGDDSPKVRVLRSKLSEIPTGWNSGTNKSGRDLFKTAISVLQKTNIQSPAEGKTVQVPKEVMLSFYILYYLTKYNPDLSIGKESGGVLKYLLGNNLNRNLKMISEHPDYLICGTEFFKKNPQYASSLVKNKVINTKV